MINVSIQTQRGRSFGWLLALSVFCMLSITSIRSYGQTLGITTASSPCTGNDGPCCFRLTFNPGSATPMRTLDINVSNPACWDWVCFELQFPALTSGGVGVTGTATGGAGSGQYSFKPTIANTNFPSGADLVLILCPKLGCDISNATITWTYTAANGLTVTQTYGFPNCNGSSYCPRCDQTTLQSGGFYNGYCYDRACFQKRSTGSATSGPFKITFNPAWTPCVQPTRAWVHTWPDGSVSYGPLCNQDGNQGNPLPPDGWTIAGPNPEPGGNNSFTVTPGIDFPFLPCDVFCINIPMCEGGKKYTVTITDLSDLGHNCTPSPSMIFKRATDGNEIGQNQNSYPNPVTRMTQFRTTIPFLLPSDGGEAKINFYSEAGNLVHTETNTFSGTGRHFFYFTGEDLPSGKYFYTIESPIGAIIVKRNLLIVK